jgi:hypothetical protein
MGIATPLFLPNRSGGENRVYVRMSVAICISATDVPFAEVKVHAKIGENRGLIADNRTPYPKYASHVT